MSLLTRAMLDQVQGEYKTNLSYANRGLPLDASQTEGRTKLGTMGVKAADVFTKFRKQWLDEKYNPMQEIIHTGSGLKLEVPTSTMRKTEGMLDMLKQKFWPTAEDYSKIDYTKLLEGDSFTEVVGGSLKTVTEPGAEVVADKGAAKILGETGSVLGKVVPWATSLYSASKVFDKKSSVGSKIGHGLLALYTNPLTSAMMMKGTAALGTAAATGWSTGGVVGATKAIGATVWSGLKIAGSYLLSLFSDRELKENIVKVGESGKGLNIYQWNYKGNPERYEGVMSDEVPEKARVPLGDSGLIGVDYTQIDVGFRRVG